MLTDASGKKRGMLCTPAATSVEQITSTAPISKVGTPTGKQANNDDGCVDPELKPLGL